MKGASLSNPAFPSVAGTIFRLLAVLFCLEMAVMYLLPYLLPPQEAYLQNLCDAALLACLFAPVLYYYIFKPYQDAAAVQKSLTEEVTARVVDGVVLLDDALVIRSFNKPAQGMFEYGEAEIVGMPGAMLFSDGLAAMMAENDAVHEVTGLRRDGSSFPLELSLSRILLGGAWMWIAIIRDITGRKRDHEKVKQALSLLTATLESTAEGILVRDLQGRAVIYNKRFQEIWGIPADILQSRNDKLMRAWVLEKLADPAEFLALTESQYVAIDQESHAVLQFKDGRVLERYAAPQVVDDEIVGRVICFRDITEQRDLELQLRHAQKMEALGTLAGGVAHDFNNILTVIMGFASLGLKDLEQGSPLKQNLDQIMKAGARAVTLTSSLLTYSRKQPMNRKVLELNDRVGKTRDFLALLIGEEVELVNDLCNEKMLVMADGELLDQVLTNLFTNARDAMGGKGRLAITTRKTELDQEFVTLQGSGAPGSFAVISISDTGAGIDKQHLEKIFEPFFTTKAPGEGTGLGLSIVYGIVKQHGGYVTVESRRGSGTTFNIYLPLLERGQDLPVAEQRRIPGGSETILMAEDDEGVRALVKCVLETSGYAVLEARDGEEAVQLFRENRDTIDLILLDVIMPKKNGKEAFDEIRNMAPRQRAIFMSGYTADILDKEAVSGAGVTLMMKPLLPHRLLEQVRRTLDEKRA